MGQTLTGFGVLLFGLVVGGVGVATLGLGIGIPMIPLGIYLMIRGVRAFAVEREVTRHPKVTREQVLDSHKAFESTRFGGFLFGILLILFGLATSGVVVGVPVIVIGAIMVWYNLVGRKTT